MDGKADLLNALHRLRAHLDATAKALSPNLNYCLNPGLKAGATLDLSLQELELACETLRRCNLESLRLLYARNGLKRWPEQPTLVLHAFEATHLDSYVPPKPSEIEHLEQALERTKEEGDMRTLHRIRIILSSMEPDFPPPRMPQEIREKIKGMDEKKLMDLLLEMLDKNFDPRIFEQILGRERMEKLLGELRLDEDPDSGPIQPPQRSGRRRR